MVIYAYQRASYVCIAKNLLQLNSKSKRQNHIRNEKTYLQKAESKGSLWRLLMRTRTGVLSVEFIIFLTEGQD